MRKQVGSQVRAEEAGRNNRDGLEVRILEFALDRCVGDGPEQLTSGTFGQD
jgi:hypothetical protein